MKSLVLALQFMTRLPMPDVNAKDADFASAMPWFPAAGLVVGIVVMAAAWLGMHFDPWLGALFALIAWVAITGALHLDGLGDIADAAGAAHASKDRLSAVLADPHIGSFGVAAITLQVVAKLVLLHVLLAHGPLWSLALVPTIARVATLVWTLTLPPLHEGLGSQFRKGVAWSHVAMWAIPTAIAIAVAPGLGIAIIAIPLWAMWLRARIGGLSGDGHGAGIELLESVMLCGLIVAA